MSLHDINRCNPLSWYFKISPKTSYSRRNPATFWDRAPAAAKIPSTKFHRCHALLVLVIPRTIHGSDTPSTFIQTAERWRFAPFHSSLDPWCVAREELKNGNFPDHTRKTASSNWTGWDYSALLLGLASPRKPALLCSQPPLLGLSKGATCAPQCPVELFHWLTRFESC